MRSEPEKTIGGSTQTVAVDVWWPVAIGLGMDQLAHWPSTLCGFKAP